jgi:hypothetical protein
MIEKIPPRDALAEMGNAVLEQTKVLWRFAASHVLTADEATYLYPILHQSTERLVRTIFSTIYERETWQGWDALIGADVLALKDLLIEVIKEFAWADPEVTYMPFGLPYPAMPEPVPRVRDETVQRLEEIGTNLANQREVFLAKAAGQAQPMDGTEADEDSEILPAGVDPLPNNPTLFQRIGNWDLSEAGVAKYKELKVPLEGQKRRLLAKLIKAQGKAVQMDRLRESCKDEEITDHTLRSLVSRLRKHLRTHLESIIGISNPIEPADPTGYRLILR